jgi:predicted glutamine amidotransferase
MARLVGYFANQTDRIRCALALESPAIAFGAERIDGWGVGSYQSGEVLLRRRPTESREALDLGDLTRDLRTSCALAHARTATVGARSLDNTHPFRHHQWLFAHTGTLPRFGDARAAILAGVPDHLARALRGDTDSEVIFYAFLGAVYRAGRLEDPDFDAQGVTAALAETVERVDRACGAEAPMCLAVTHGQAMVAFARGAPLSYILRRGVRDCAVCRRPPDVAGREARRVDHESLRYVVLADAAVDAPGWQRAPGGEEAPGGGFVAVDRALEVRATAR